MTTQPAPSPNTSDAADADGTTDGIPFGYGFFLPSCRSSFGQSQRASLDTERWRLT